MFSGFHYMLKNLRQNIDLNGASYIDLYILIKRICICVEGHKKVFWMCQGERFII